MGHPSAVRFESQQVSGPEQQVPRMDVAAFLGFASSGPPDVPVLVETEAQFFDIFGPVPLLYHDPQSGQPVGAYLAPTVTAFFKNGGRRCYVVRVVSESACARFALPGLVGWDAVAATPLPAVVQARSPGVWPKAFTVNTVLHATLLGYGRLSLRDGLALEGLVGLSDRVVPGDLLRITCIEHPTRTAYVVVGDEPLIPSAGTGDDVSWPLSRAPLWFDATPLDMTGLKAVVHDPAAMATDQAATITVWRARPLADKAMELIVPGTRPISAGAVLEFRLNDGERYLAPVLAARTAYGPEAQAAGGSLTAEATVITSGPGVSTSQAPGNIRPNTLWTVEQLTCEFKVRTGSGSVQTLSQLGFTWRHPRFFGRLPTDTQFYRSLANADALGSNDLPWAALVSEITMPRFPLATTLAAGDEAVFLPLHMDRPDILPDSWLGQLRPASLQDPAPISSGLLIDPALAQLDVDGLSQHIAWVEQNEPEKLKGILAVWPLSEVTMIAVPDAVHPACPPVAALPPPLPVLGTRPASDGPGSEFHLTLTAPERQIDYLLQGADDPLFQWGVTEKTLSATRIPVPINSASPDLRYWRIRGSRKGAAPGPWSNTVRSGSAPGGFVGGRSLASPVLLVQSGAGSWELVWNGDTRVAYTVEIASSPDFPDGMWRIHVGQACAWTVLCQGDQIRFARVRGHSYGEDSPWSNVVRLQPPLAGSSERPAALSQPTASPDDTLVGIHLAVLRMARARGDLFAALSCPLGYGDTAVAQHAHRLSQGLAPRDRAALGHGSLYTPWLATPAGVRGATAIPPDGAMLGQMASVTLQEGPWMPPANQPLYGVGGPDHQIFRPVLALLERTHVNVLQRDGAGTLTTMANTLSMDPQYTPIPVRRMLAFLRRLLMQQASTLLFETNDAELWTYAQYSLEAIMTDLFVRGALAGSSPAEAFQVTVDGTDNPPGAVDSGVLTIQLRVAIAQPITYITVILRQTVDGQSQVSEV